jgi:putative endonuclease
MASSYAFRWGLFYCTFNLWVINLLILAQHNEIGKIGEELAIAHLCQQGWEILATNWRFKRAEIDIIAMDGNTLVFVEVKTRSTTYFGTPEQFVNAKKKLFLAKAASAYMEEIGHDWEIRFDIISVLLPRGKEQEIKHFKDAFFPGLL